MRDIRLKTLLFFQLVSFSVVPILVIALVFRFVVYPAIERDNGDHLRSIAISVRDQTAQYLRLNRDSLALVRNQIVGQAEGHATPLLDVLVQTVDSLDLVYLVGPDNLVSEIGLPPARRPFRADYLDIEANTGALVKRVRASGQEEWSETYLSLTNGEMTVALAIPVDERVLVAELSLSRLTDFLRRLSAADDILPMVIDERGGLIAHTIQDTPINTVNIDFLHHGDNSKDSAKEFHFGHHCLVGYEVDMPDSKWIVVIAQTVSSFREVIDYIYISLVYGLISSFLFSALSAIFLSRRFGVGFNALAEHAEAIAAGVYDHMPPRTRVREINRISVKLKDLGAAVRERESNLKREVETNARILAAIDLARDLISVSDRERRLVHTNRTALRSLGIPGVTLEGLLGRNWRDFQGEAFSTAILDLFDQVDRVGNSEGELEWVRPDNGRILHFLCRMSSLPDGGYIHVWTDITEKIRLESDRRRTEQRAAQASKMEALGHLAGGIAHDFNNLLGAMLGFAQFLVQDTPPGSQLRHFANRIVTAGNRGKSLIQQILTFSRRGVFEPVAVPLEDAIGETCDLLRAILPSSTQLILRFPPHPVAVRADKGQLSQVLINLCINANDAMLGEAGAITIEVAALDRTRPELARLSAPAAGPSSGAVEFWGGEPGESWIVTGTLPETATVLIRVSDEGTGIPPDILGHLFDPFFTTKETGRGTGLGLAVVHSIICEHGGGVVVHSRQGQGTRFEVILPEADLADLVADRAAPSSAPNPDKATILIVDDDPDFCHMLEMALSRVGHDVVSTNDPQQALAAIVEEPGQWDLLITDQTMPTLKGTDLIRQAKALRPDLRCIICSGYSSQMSEREATLAGAVLNKPVDLDELHRIVQSLLKL
ncbi:ATP-binding protein [Magnetospirillum fulvum]|uniref:histidine kinase n=1 Tax=Magnetospirillum fulvum TaxID=1082 RepID=A0A1H6IXL3_MAGFU|nr:ATP-binding protein [Magnetospirillum fulvum]SEH51285.1 His Kinase A (phospho-acceptor) domain-containing protein [Magnetospirillum fulvum]